MARFLTVSGKVRILIAGWWFQTCVIFHFIYGTILPIDFHSIIFQDAYSTTNQNTLELIDHMLHSLVGLIKLDYVECQAGRQVPLPSATWVNRWSIRLTSINVPSVMVGVHSHPGMVAKSRGFAVDYSSWCVVINLTLLMTDDTKKTTNMDVMSRF